jgi:mRNA-degrading endonuclease RelE of RelBE toxin-antitoxin system
VNYQIKIFPLAHKEIRELHGYVRAQALQLIDQLGENPRPARAKELRDKPNIHRIWLAGHWRIVYQVDDDLSQVNILRVRRKEQIDYESL